MGARKTPRKKTTRKRITVTRTQQEKPCEWCGEFFWATRPTRARFCSARCKMAAHRAGKK